MQGHPERPTLAYILFSFHLKLGHNDDAYDAMVSNPDIRRRKDSLRQVFHFNSSKEMFGMF